MEPSWYSHLCVLQPSMWESRDHLFLVCSFAKTIWQKILQPLLEMWVITRTRSLIGLSSIFRNNLSFPCSWYLGVHVYVSYHKKFKNFQNIFKMFSTLVNLLCNVNRDWLLLFFSWFTKLIDSWKNIQMIFKTWQGLFLKFRWILQRFSWST